MSDDEQMVDYQKMTVAELQREFENRNLDVPEGNKAELVKALEADDAKPDVEDDNDEARTGGVHAAEQDRADSEPKLPTSVRGEVGNEERIGEPGPHPVRSAPANPDAEMSTVLPDDE